MVIEVFLVLLNAQFEGAESLHLLFNQLLFLFKQLSLLFEKFVNCFHAVVVVGWCCGCCVDAIIFVVTDGAGKFLCRWCPRVVAYAGVQGGFIVWVVVHFDVSMATKFASKGGLIRCSSDSAGLGIFD